MNREQTKLQDAKLGAAIDDTCQSLPEDWAITICLEQGSGFVTLINEEGAIVDFPSNQETLGETIRDALGHALQLTSAATSERGKPE
jgi:hypothetical protein